MKGRITSVITVLVLVISLWGCQPQREELESAAVDFMEAVKACDTDYLEQNILDMGVLKEDDGDKEQNETLGIFKGQLKDYLKEWNGKITYKINRIETDETRVQVKCKFIDASDFVEEEYRLLFKAIMAGRFGSDSTGESRKKELERILKKAYDSIKEETYDEKYVELVFEKDKGIYKIRRVDQDLEDLMTAYVLTSMKDAKESIGENF